jgi:hypothetical protein
MSLSSRSSSSSSADMPAACLSCKASAVFVNVALQVVLFMWHQHPAQSLQHVCQLHSLTSRHHRGHPEAGETRETSDSCSGSCCSYISLHMWLVPLDQHSQPDC